MDLLATTSEVGCSSAGFRNEKRCLLTYKRRKCDAAVSTRISPRKQFQAAEVTLLRNFRKNLDPRLDTPVGERDEKEDIQIEASPSNSEPALATPEKLDTVTAAFKRAPPLITMAPDRKRTVAPQRVCGQYFLDLGQADFTHTTCPSCGLVYARGQESDEKLHTAFHRSQLQGIRFKGWRCERVALRLSSKGDRVIYVLPGDPVRHLYKVREVVRVMEQEMGLAPGWLWQQHCKVYLFISAAKKIVGCILAESISIAFPVVPSNSQDKNLQPPTQECQCKPETSVNPCKNLLGPRKSLPKPPAEDIPEHERFYRRSLNSRLDYDTLCCQKPGREAQKISSPKDGDPSTSLSPISNSALPNTDLRAVPSILPLTKQDTDKDVSIFNSSSTVPPIENSSGEKTRHSTRLRFGDWKFSREVVTRKQIQIGADQSEGRAIVCSKIGVPSVCGVRGMWVSRSERRKGVATHLLDAMRKTFCLGWTLQPSQCAFSQPTPDGQAFASQYYGSETFLVYHNNR